MKIFKRRPKSTLNMKLPPFKSDVFLAPMADVSDAAFRLICKRYGAGLTCTEMISVNDIIREEKNSLKKMEGAVEEEPRAIQLYAVNKDNLVKAIKYCASEAQIIDLNCSCPADKIVEQGGGSALLEKPEKLRELIKAASSAINIPFTCKLRLGFSEENILAISKLCEEAGASMITIHGRTRHQHYGGKADWSLIKKVKETVTIPVCGNGDVNSVEDYLRMKKETGCDYVMIGRAAIGNPYIFKQITDYTETGKYLPATKKQTLADLKEYLNLAEELKVTFNQTKYQTMLFLERILWNKEIGHKLNNCKKRKELNELVESIKL